jgi:hypothetical protein
MILPLFALEHIRRFGAIHIPRRLRIFRISVRLGTTLFNACYLEYQDSQLPVRIGYIS